MPIPANTVPAQEATEEGLPGVPQVFGEILVKLTAPGIPGPKEVLASVP